MAIPHLFWHLYKRQELTAIVQAVMREYDCLYLSLFQDFSSPKSTPQATPVSPAGGDNNCKLSFSWGVIKLLYFFVIAFPRIHASQQAWLLNSYIKTWLKTRYLRNCYCIRHIFAFLLHLTGTYSSSRFLFIFKLIYTQASLDLQYCCNDTAVRHSPPHSSVNFGPMLRPTVYWRRRVSSICSSSSFSSATH